MNKETSSVKEPLEEEAGFLKKLIHVLSIIIILDLGFRIISVVAPERINYVTYIPGMVFIFLVIPLGYRLRSIKKKLVRFS